MDDKLSLISLKGHVKIEVFDAKSGKLVQCEEGDNLITNLGANIFRRMMLKTLGLNTIDWVSGYRLYPRANTGYWATSPLFYLYMTDNDADPSASNPLITGNITGFSVMQDLTSTDVLRGFQNRAESVMDMNSLKLVYDFATDRANGVHKAVYLAACANTIRIAADIIPMQKPALIVPAASLQNLVDAGDDYLYGIASNQLYKLSKIDGRLISQTTLPRSPASPYAYVAGHDGFIYYTVSSTMYKYSLTSNSEVATISVTAPSSNARFAVVDGFLYYVYFSGGPYIRRVDLSTFVMDTTMQQITVASTIRQVCDVNGLALIDGAGDVRPYNWSTNTLGSVLLNWGDTIYTPDRVFDIPSAPSNNFKGILRLNGKWYAAIPVQREFFNGSSIFATEVEQNCFFELDTSKAVGQAMTHKKLTTPVTKDNTQTMKVTYTLNFV